MNFTNQMKKQYACPLCEKVYVSECNLERHVCKVKEKIDYLSTNRGQRAFYLYNEWRHYKKIPKSEIFDFINSRYFLLFKKFEEYTTRVNLPSISLFIEYAVSNNIQPNIWCDKRLITKYYQYIDNEVDPIRIAEISIKTILRYCDINHIPTNLFFKKIPFNLLINYIQLRKLSPWVILLSSEFKTMYKKANRPQQSIFEKQVNLMLWKVRFSQNNQPVKFIKCLLNQINL